jgi:hypothetical protein
MAKFDGRELGEGNGAVLYLQEKVPKSARLALNAGIVFSEKGSRALVVRLFDRRYSAIEAVLQESIQLAQEVLDHWAVKGVFARTLAAIGDGHIVWRKDSCSVVVCRIWTTARLNFALEIQGEVRDRDGKVVPPAVEVVPDWHPSFRFFRLGQATTDLVDAFRNYYLALESILSTIEPIAFRSNGKPAEGEKKWLDRALAKAAEFVELGKYVDAIGEDPIDSLGSEIYTGARTSTFHAKNGAQVFLPHDDVTRSALRGSVVRLRRLYLDLAQAVLKFRFIGGGGLAFAGFQAMASGLSIDKLYVSDELVNEVAINEGKLPSSFITFEAAHVGELDGEYQIAYSGNLAAKNWPCGTIRQFGTILNGAVGIYEDLDGVVDIEGIENIEFIVMVVAQDPQALGTRYLS